MKSSKKPPLFKGGGSRERDGGFLQYYFYDLILNALLLHE